MEVPRLDMSCSQGATFKYVVRLLDENGQPVNLTGYTAAMHVRATQKSPTTIIQLSNTIGGISIDPLAGVLELRISPTRTAALPASKAAYDLKLTAPGGTDAFFVLEGAFVIKGKVTH